MILAIETSTDACSVALTDGQAFHEIFVLAPQKHAEIILQHIDGLLSQQQITLEHIDAIAFGQGPGSFMGIRIAAAVAGALSFALQKPLVPVSSLEILSYSAVMHVGLSNQPYILAGLDARMGEIYWNGFIIDAEKNIQSVLADQICKPQVVTIPEKLQVLSEKWFAVGNGWRNYWNLLDSDFKKHLQLEEEITYPHAKALALLGLKKFIEKRTISPLEINPEYLREAVT